VWAEEGKSRLEKIKDEVFSDYKNFYSGQNLGKLAIGLGAAGIFANSSLDRELREEYQRCLRSDGTDEFSDFVKQFGDMAVLGPVYVGTLILGELAKNTEAGSIIGEWSQRSLRTLLVGAPVMSLLQVSLGSSRPSEDDSDWQPFDDNNAVSGHSFLGAVPFLNAAQMMDNKFLKGFFYVVSALPGLSRINDDKHYFSQVLLGWWLAYLSSTSIDKTEEQKFVIAPLILPDGGGVVVLSRF